MARLMLKRAPIGDNQEDYDVLEDGVTVGRIFLSPVAPQDRPYAARRTARGRYASVRPELAQTDVRSRPKTASLARAPRRCRGNLGRARVVEVAMICPSL